MLGLVALVGYLGAQSAAADYQWPMAEIQTQVQSALSSNYNKALTICGNTLAKAPALSGCWSQNFQYPSSTVAVSQCNVAGQQCLFQVTGSGKVTLLQCKSQMADCKDTGQTSCHNVYQACIQSKNQKVLDTCLPTYTACQTSFGSSCGAVWDACLQQIQSGASSIIAGQAACNVQTSQCNNAMSAIVQNAWCVQANCNPNAQG